MSDWGQATSLGNKAVARIFDDARNNKRSGVTRRDYDTLHTAFSELLQIRDLGKKFSDLVIYEDSKGFRPFESLTPQDTVNAYEYDVAFAVYQQLKDRGVIAAPIDVFQEAYDDAYEDHHD